MGCQDKKSDHREISSQDVPSKRVKHGLRPPSPFRTTRLSRLIYILIFLTAFLAAYYHYRVMQYKRQVGGGWDAALGRSTHTNHIPLEHPRNHHTSIEDKINDLAKALGIPTQDLASVIAVAVQNYVPPASLPSVAAKETGPAVKVRSKEPHRES